MIAKKPVALLAALLAFGVLGSQALDLGSVPDLPIVSKAGADMRPIKAGDTPEAKDIHLITQPGLYGLGSEQSDSHYAIVNETLVRVDAKTLKILSILRSPVRILD